MKLVESTWRVYGSGAYRGVTLTHRADPPAREAWIVRWAVGEGDWRQWSGEDPVAVLRYAADQAPGVYRDAILAAAANPPSVPDGRAPIVGTWRTVATDPPPVGYPLLCAWDVLADHTDTEVLCQEEDGAWRHKETGSTDYNRPKWWMPVPPLPPVGAKNPQAGDPPSVPGRSELSPQPERPTEQAPSEEWIAAALLSGWEAGRDMRHEGMTEDVLADQWQATESGAALTEGARWNFIRGVRAARRRATFSATLNAKD